MDKKSQKLNRFQILYRKNKRFRAFSITAGTILGIAVFVLVSFLMIRLGNAHVITVAISEEPETLDPTFCENADTETVLVNCFEGLMRIDENGEAVKAAASNYTVSEDGLVYNFTISADSKWSNGETVTASDFVYAWLRTANPYNSSAYASMFENIVGYDKILEDFEKEQKGIKDEDGNYVSLDMSDLWVKAVDENTIAIKLTEKDASFLQKLAGVAFMPLCEKVVAANTRTWSTDDEKFVSNGAFYMSSWTGGSSLQLTKNPHFRDAENVKAKLVKFNFISDGKEAVSKFEKSAVLFTDVLYEQELEKTSKKQEYVSYENFGSYFLYFNLSKAPFDDIRVRQALTLAIDRQRLVDETAKTRGIPAAGIISNAFSSYRDGTEYVFDAKENEKNISTAKALLKEAGYENGKDFPSFEYLFNDNTYSRKTAELLQKMWKENLGIECELKSVSWSKLEQMRKEGDFSVAKGGLLAENNDVSYILDPFMSKNNFCSWKNDEYDNLVLQLTNSSADKLSCAHMAEKILMQNYVVCPLYYYADGYLASDRLLNYYVTNSGVAYFIYADVKVF